MQQRAPQTGFEAFGAVCAQKAAPTRGPAAQLLLARDVAAGADAAARGKRCARGVQRVGPSLRECAGACVRAPPRAGGAAAARFGVSSKAAGCSHALAASCSTRSARMPQRPLTTPRRAFLQPPGEYQCPLCLSWTSRLYSRLDAHMETCTGPPLRVAEEPVPPPPAATKRTVPYTAGPKADTFPSNWWAPVASMRAPGMPHEATCGACQAGLADGGSVSRCATCPASFHVVCLASAATGQPPSDALAAGWRCPTCEVRAARGTELLLCNMCKRPAGQRSGNRMLLAMHADEPHALAVHKVCADYNSGHGNFPYEPRVLWREFWRGRQLKCALCSKSGATAGCALSACDQSYHVQCALEHPERVTFCSAVALACVQHRVACGIPDCGPLKLPPPAPPPAAAPRAAAPARGVLAAHKPDCRCRPCAKRRREGQPAAGDERDAKRGRSAESNAAGGASAGGGSDGVSDVAPL